MARKTFIFAMVALYSAFSVFRAEAQNVFRTQKNVFESEIYFRFDDSRIDPDYMSNEEIFSSIDSIIQTIGIDHIDSIVIKTQSSPEGVYEYNLRLSDRRARSIHRFIVSRWTNLSDKVRSDQHGEAWGPLKEAVITDTLLTAKEKDMTLSVLNADMDIVTRKISMRKLPFYRDLKRRLYPSLRYSAICLIYFTEERVPIATLPELPVPVAETCAIYTTEALAEPPVQQETPPSPEYRTPIIAFKTNLLLPALNAGIQLPIGTHWSVGADWYWPWIWPSEKNDKCYELLGGYVEGRYWFGRNRQKTQRLLGHSIGLHAGGGYYDLEKNYRGMQGEFAITGLDYKFALPLGKSRWGHLDFLIGFGYIYSSGRTYDVFYKGGPLIPDDNVVKFQFFGPTRAEISLTIPIYSRKEGRK